MINTQGQMWVHLRLEQLVLGILNIKLVSWFDLTQDKAEILICSLLLPNPNQYLQTILLNEVHLS